MTPPALPLTVGIQRRGRRAAHPSGVTGALPPSWGGARAATGSAFLHGDLRALLMAALAMAEAGAIVVAAALAHILRHGLTPLHPRQTVMVLIAVVMYGNAVQMTGGYRAPGPAGPLGQAGLAVKVWSLVFVLLVALGAFLKVDDAYSRIWAALLFILGLLGVLGARGLVAGVAERLQRRGFLARTVAVVDLSGEGARLVGRMRRQAPGEIRLLGVFRPQQDPQGASGLDDLFALSKHFRIDDIVVATPDRTDPAMERLVRTLGQIPANVRICPEIGRLARERQIFDVVFGEPMLRVHHRPLDGFSSLTKRLMDVCLGAALALFVAPVMVAVAVAVKLDTPGPAIFKQKRLGFNNDVITVWKFRSMEHGAERDGGIEQARRGDRRVTRVGRFIRRYSLDELPQLFNVLRGDMSLVGPRPHALGHNEYYAALIDGYLARHRVRPGITGLAQINGFRGETDTLDKMERRIEQDLAYIENWSLGLDLRILLLTPFYGLFSRNAF